MTMFLPSGKRERTFCFKLFLHRFIPIGKHTISIIIDRVVVKEEAKSRITQSVELALQKSKGLVIVDIVDENREIIFSEKLACPKCNLSFEELNPRIF